MARKKSSPLVVIVGETASGKSALALELAEKFDGEIITADSRTVYTGMDIGTAKPPQAEQERIAHHVLDVVSPDEKFSAADFKRLANRAITDISARGKLPIMVGGTGLYVDAVLYDFEFREIGDAAARAELSKLSVEELQQRLEEKGLALPENARNPRHLIRVLETNGAGAGRKPLRANTLILGLRLPREELEVRIRQRVEKMVKSGLVEEVKRLVGQYGNDAEALRAPGYKAFREYVYGTLSLEEAKALFIKNDMQLAKRQRTWFKRNKSIHWISGMQEAEQLVQKLLRK